MSATYTVPPATSRTRVSSPRWIATVAVAALLGVVADAAAQQAPATPAERPVATSGAVTQQALVDVNRLPVNVQRIQRELVQRTREREVRDGLNLQYIIDVFGQAPPIEIFSPDDNLVYGPVPYGAPTHREMLYMITPQEFRSPVMDFSNLMRWLSDRNK